MVYEVTTGLQRANEQSAKTFSSKMTPVSKHRTSFCTYRLPAIYACNQISVRVHRTCAQSIVIKKEKPKSSEMQNLSANRNGHRHVMTSLTSSLNSTDTRKCSMALTRCRCNVKLSPRWITLAWDQSTSHHAIVKESPFMRADWKLFLCDALLVVNLFLGAFTNLRKTTKLRHVHQSVRVKQLGSHNRFWRNFLFELFFSKNCR